MCESGNVKTDFADVYKNAWPRILGYMLVRVENVPEAEDLTEQAFIKAWQAYDRFEDRGVHVDAWLFRIARNVLISWARQRTQHASIDDAVDVEAPEVAIGYLDDFAQLIEELTPTQQQVLILRFWDDLDPPAIAEMMGSNEGAVRAIQFRALQRLRATIA